jgi:DNA-binding NarL/FixJ family response regulator
MLAERLQQLIAAGSGELRVPKQGHGSWIFRLCPSTRQCGSVHASAMILRISDPDRTGEALDSAKLRERLGLTVRQAQAVAALVKGGTEDMASAELRISKATLHTHVTHAYDCLGVHNRAALVALLASHGFDVTSGG